MASFFTAVLLALKICEPKDVWDKTPWSVLILVAGTGVYMGICVKLRGIDLVANGMRAISNAATVTPIYSFVAGFMSWFTYALAVPIPGLIPTASNVAQSLGLSMAHEYEIVVAITCGAFCATTSPVSMYGAIINGLYDTIVKPDVKARNQAFRTLLATSVVITMAVSVFLGIGFIRALF